MDAALRRTEIIASHIVEEQQRHAVSFAATAGQQRVPRDDDVVVVAAVRSAIGKAKRGAFRNTGQDKMLVPLIKHVLDTTKVNPSLIGDVVIGNVLPLSSISATEVRIASLLAGIPKETPCYTVNRQCSSGLQAIVNVATAIRAGHYDIGLAGGVENMSLNEMGNTGNLQMNDNALNHDMAKGCYASMGQTSEEVATRFNISRKDQDEFSVQSHAKALNAIKEGRFKEVVPVPVEVEDKGELKRLTLAKDEGPRAGTTLEALSKLKPVFKEGGSTTAGNSSQTSDGAAVVLLARRSAAKKHGLPVLGALLSSAVVGVEPAIMGVGPAYAIPEALKRAGVSKDQISVYEINEAFASQAIYCVRHLDIPLAKVNPLGGAIALGHPLGCTGARMTATLLHQLKAGELGVVSMCIGSGMGMAAVYVRE